MVRSVDPLSKLRGAADFRPSRDERGLESRAARIVGILIRVHLDPAVARRLNALHQRLRQPPRTRAERLHVRDDSRQPRFFRHADHLVDRSDAANIVIGLVSDVSLVDDNDLARALPLRGALAPLRARTWRT